MQFDERWRQAALNSSLGIESVIDYESFLMTATTRTFLSSSNFTALSSITTVTTTILNSSSSSSTSPSQSTEQPTHSSGNNNMTTVVIVVIVVLVVLSFVGIAIVFKVLVFPRALAEGKRTTLSSSSSRSPSKWRIWSLKITNLRTAWRLRHRLESTTIEILSPDEFAALCSSELEQHCFANVLVDEYIDIEC
jgi:hypothetical protein